MAEKTAKKEKSKKTKVCEEKKDDIYGSKKPPMKTASDVISRLLWDDSLSPEKFVVGYLDRFDGIIEKSFDTLDWRDPAIVDNNTLAIPKHRIQYFKYRNRKVWDKRNRTDIVFGSTGYPLDIHAYIALVDNEIQNFQDEIHILENGSPEAQTGQDSDDDDVVSEEETDMTDRPNFFIAIRMSNPTTVENLKEVSDFIKSRDEILGQCCMASETMHLTLSILKLSSPLEVSNAVEALRAVSEANISKISINLNELDNFQHRVLYARVDENEELLTLRKRLVNELVSRNVIITDRYSFVPHVTIAKLSRPFTRLRHSKYIDQYFYLKFEDNEFGVQDIDKLYLCEMGSARREDGFYRCAYEVSL